MDRVNRSFLVVTTLIAVPAVLVMASFSTGTSPHVRQAIAHEVDDAGTIQQVVGKEIKTPQTKPGLFQVITGNRTQGSQDHRHENMSGEEPRGLLDGLFEGRSNSRSGGSSNQTRNQNHNHNHASTQRTSPAPSGRAASNTDPWVGIPYHQVDSSQPETGVQPIRDPSEQIASGPTRIIRGGTNRPTPARTISARRPSGGPTLAPTPAPPLAVPTPPADIEPLPAPTRSFASESNLGRTSSRRSNRRELQPLNPSEVAAASKSADGKVTETELVPRVVRKQLSDVSDSTASETLAPAPAKPAESIATRPSPAEPTPVADVVPEANTALAAIGSPNASPLPEPPSSVDMTPIAPETQAPVSAAAPETASPAGPIAGIPSHPYAASTPSAAVPSITASHRSGPPTAAFQPTEPQFTPTATPVGSGVVPQGEVATFRQSNAPQSNAALTSQPYVGNYTIPNDASAGTNGAPAGANGAPAGTGQGRMTTFGQPVAAPVQPVTPTPPQTVPVQPIPRHPSLPPGGDNFARADQSNRNQMRAAGDTASASSASELPGIRVVTYGPPTMMLRQTSQYEIRVENRGAIDATGVLVRAIVPDWADVRARNATRGDVNNETQGSTERLVWTIDHLPAGASEQMFVRLTASQSGTFNLDVDWTLLPQKSVTQVQVHEPRLDLTIEGPDEVVYGKSQTYKVRVLNPGDGTAPNVVFTLSPNSATPQSQRIGDIPPGKEAQFDVELTAQDLGDLKIHGLASGDLELRAEASKTIKVAAAKLEAVFSGPELKYQNTEATYNLQVQNTGAATSEKIIASLRLPTGVKYLGGMDGAVSQANVLKWEITALAPGASRDYQFRCSMSSTGEHLFAFECSGTAAGSASVAIATRVESIADLVLTVSDPPAPAPIGSEVTYEIVIRNRGSKEATDVQAVAQFSHGIEPQRIEGQSGEVVTGQVLFDLIPRIGAGQEVRLRVIAKADRGGHHRFRTEVKSGDTVLVAEEATHYMSPRSERVSRRSSDEASR